MGAVRRDVTTLIGAIRFISVCNEEKKMMKQNNLNANCRDHHSRRCDERLVDNLKMLACHQSVMSRIRFPLPK